MDVYSLNLMILVGHMAGDIRYEKPRSGLKTSWCRFQLATNEVFSVKNEVKKKVEYHNVVAWGKKADNIYKWGKKGRALILVGKLRHRRWKTEEDEWRHMTEVNIDWYTWLGKSIDFEEPEHPEVDEKEEEEKEEEKEENGAPF